MNTDGHLAKLAHVVVDERLLTLLGHLSHGHLILHLERLAGEGVLPRDQPLRSIEVRAAGALLRSLQRFELIFLALVNQSAARDDFRLAHELKGRRYIGPFDIDGLLAEALVSSRQPFLGCVLLGLRLTSRVLSVEF